MSGKAKLATSDSKVYKHTFYGILNAQGDFWTPLAFETERAAMAHLEGFWRADPAKFASVQRTHKIVPVRIRLDQLPKPKGHQA